MTTLLHYIFYAVYIIAVAFFIYYEIMFFRKYKKSLAVNASYHDLNRDLLNRLNLWTVTSMILTMKLCAANHNYDEYVKMYHALYFLGVDKDILDHSDKLDDFMSDCMQNHITVSNGIKPFTYSFVKNHHDA